MFFAAQRDQANITTGSFIRFYPHRGPHEQEADPRESDRPRGNARRLVGLQQNPYIRL